MSEVILNSVTQQNVPCPPVYLAGLCSAVVTFKGEIKDFKEENSFRTQKKKPTHDNKHGESLVGGKVAHGCKELWRRQRRRVKGGRALQPLSEEEKGSGLAGMSASRPAWANCFLIVPVRLFVVAKSVNKVWLSITTLALLATCPRMLRKR